MTFKQHTHYLRAKKNVLFFCKYIVVPVRFELQETQDVRTICLHNLEERFLRPKD